MEAICELNGEQVYRDGTGYWSNSWRYPRSSRILDIMDLPGLDKWRANVGTDKAEEISSQSRDIGHEIHRIINELDTGRLRFAGADDPRWTMLTPEIKNGLICWQQAQKYFKWTGVASELLMVSHKYGYACMTDRVLKIDGELEIFDWKSRRNILTDGYSEHFPQIVAKIKMQLASYWNVFEEMTGKQIARARAIPLYIDRGSWTKDDQIILEKADFQDYFDGFLGLKKVYNLVYGWRK